MMLKLYTWEKQIIISDFGIKMHSLNEQKHIETFYISADIYNFTFYMM